MSSCCKMSWALALGSSVFNLPMVHAEVISATPSRPTVSSSAQLSAPGFFELETGYQKIKGSEGDSRMSFPTRLKYSFSESAFGLEADVIASTARDGLGVDKTAYSLNGIFSAALGEFSADLNLGVIHPLGVGTGEGHNGWHWATSVAHALNDSWGVVGEFSGAGRRRPSRHRDANAISRRADLQRFTQNSARCRHGAGNQSGRAGLGGVYRSNGAFAVISRRHHNLAPQPQRVALRGEE